MKWIGVYVVFASLNFALLSPVPIGSHAENGHGQDAPIFDDEIMIDDSHSGSGGVLLTATTKFNIHAPEFDFENAPPASKSIDVELETSTEDIYRILKANLIKIFSVLFSILAKNTSV